LWNTHPPPWIECNSSILWMHLTDFANAACRFWTSIHRFRKRRSMILQMPSIYPASCPFDFVKENVDPATKVDWSRKSDIKWAFWATQPIRSSLKFRKGPVWLFLQPSRFRISDQVEPNWDENGTAKIHEMDLRIDNCPKKVWKEEIYDSQANWSWFAAEIWKNSRCMNSCISHIFERMMSRCSEDWPRPCRISVECNFIIHSRILPLFHVFCTVSLKFRTSLSILCRCSRKAGAFRGQLRISSMKRKVDNNDHLWLNSSEKSCDMAVVLRTPLCLDFAPRSPASFAQIPREMNHQNVPWPERFSQPFQGSKRADRRTSNSLSIGIRVWQPARGLGMPDEKTSITQLACCFLLEDHWALGMNLWSYPETRDLCYRRPWWDGPAAVFLYIPGRMFVTRKGSEKHDALLTAVHCCAVFTLFCWRQSRIWWNQFLHNFSQSIQLSIRDQSIGNIWWNFMRNFMHVGARWQFWNWIHKAC
jgi:hypothetical protein